MSHSSVRFKWNKKRSDVALYLAAGHTVDEAAAEYKVSARQIFRWKHDTEFAAEVDRLTLMVDIAGRAERLRLAMRVIRSKKDSRKDLLEWLQYVQSETDGAKIDITGLLAAVAALASPVAGSGQTGSDGNGDGSDEEAE